MPKSDMSVFVFYFSVIECTYSVTLIKTNLMKIPFEIENVTVATVNAIEYECISHLTVNQISDKCRLIHYIWNKAAGVHFIL